MSLAPARKRLRGKTSVAVAPACSPPTAVPGGPGLVFLQVLSGPVEDESTSVKRRAYLITLPHPRVSHDSEGNMLVPPGRFSRQQILEITRDCMTRPIYSDLGNAARASGDNRGTHLEKATVLRELHGPDDEGTRHPHYHVALVGSAAGDGGFRFGPVKRAFLLPHHLATHWSCSHTGYWSCIRYGFYPSPKYHSTTTAQRKIR